MKQRKPMIAFFGIDGSGKTTLIGEVSKKIQETKKEKVRVVYMGLGNEFNLPFLKQIMKLSSFIKYRNKKRDEKTLRKYNYRQRSFFWVLGQYMEFWIRYFKAKRYSKNKIVFFDRFFYDGLILGGSFTYNVFKFLTPVPDKSFLIFAPSKVINKRKDEAEIKDIKKYYKRAEKLSKHFPIIKIDNAKRINEVVNEIYEKIYSSKNKYF